MRNPVRKAHRLRLTWARATALTLGLGGLLSLGPRVEAFFPTNLRTVFGALGTSHQKITEQAIKDLDAEFFGITRLTKPMKKAIENIADANIAVDDDQTTSAKHFDAENLAGGQLFITQTNRPTVLSSLANDNAAGARFALGQALHTIQDFYSHTNWIERGNSSPNGAVGVPGAAIGPAAGPGDPTCRDCIGSIPPICPDCSSNLITGVLTSGYYSGEDRVKPGPFKCSHGGILDGSATGEFGFGINKDSTDCAFSPHHNLHSAAVSVAREATKKFIREIKAEVTERQIKQLLGVGPTLAMAIDTTGSMGPIISQVKAAATGIVNARLDTDEEPSKYVLAPFNDPSVGPTTATSDPDAFNAAINSLFASGGGDCPELSMTGMLQALAASDEGGDLFMFTDASSKDGGLAGAVSSLATSKDIKVFPITFGSCSPLDPAYIRIASESGGQVFQLSTFEAGKITQLADFIVRSNAVDVLSIASTLAGAPQTFAVPVDLTMTRVTFSVSGTTAVTIRRPDGSAVGAGDAGVSFVSLSTGAIYSIVRPPTGAWSVQLGGTGAFTLNVSGESELDLDSFRFVERRGRPGHDGFFAIAGLPVSGQSSTVVGVLSGAPTSVNFELRRKDGTLLQALDLGHGPGEGDEEFSGALVPPDIPFLVYALGLDASGLPFQRLVPASVRPQPVKIAAPPAQNLVRDSSATYAFQVTNFGVPDTFRFSASDDRRFITGVGPQFFTLGTGESIAVDVSLFVPASAVPGTSDTLTATVESATGAESRNFAVVTSNVVEVTVDTTPPTISAVTATPNQLWPPNHSMRTVTVTIEVADDQDPSPTCQIAGVSSNEPVGATDPDWIVTPGSLTLQLRAEREGGGDGRVYAIDVECTDETGNIATAFTRVIVPHDQGH